MSMNRREFLPVLAVAEGEVTVWLRRETLDDVLALDPLG